MILFSLDDKSYERFLKEKDMIEVLKEMGTVCQNKRLGELLKDFHRRKFEEVRY